MLVLMYLHANAQRFIRVLEDKVILLGHNTGAVGFTSYTRPEALEMRCITNKLEQF